MPELLRGAAALAEPVPGLLLLRAPGGRGHRLREAGLERMQAGVWRKDEAEWFGGEGESNKKRGGGKKKTI